MTIPTMMDIWWFGWQVEDNQPPTIEYDVMYEYTETNDDEIDDYGRQQIRSILFDVMKRELPTPANLGERIQRNILNPTLKKQVNGMRLTKYLSKYMHDRYGINLSPGILTEIGNIASNYAKKPFSGKFEFSHDLMWDAGDFGDGGSCFWNDYWYARPTILYAGGGAIKFYNKSGRGMGRCWFLMDRPKKGEFIIFNGYGRNDSYDTRKLAMIIASMFGLKLQPIDLELGEGVYVNSRSAYVLGKTQPAYTEYEDYLLVDHDEDYRGGPCCEDCGYRMDEDESYYIDNHGYVCGDCICNYAYCDYCGDYVVGDEATNDVHYAHRYGDRRSTGTLCDDCADSLRVKACDGCSEHYSKKLYREDSDGFVVCDRCSQDYELCENCDVFYSTHHHDHCPDCEECKVCGDLEDNYHYDKHHNPICGRCYRTHKVCNTCGEWRAINGLKDGKCNECSD